jgi:hypothetical protein
MAKKGTSDRGVRTEESGVDTDVPIADAAHGDEGIDRGSTDQTSQPGNDETQRKGASESRDIDPERMGTGK